MPAALRNLTVYTDGASRSNPGHAACAYLVALEGQDPCKTHKQYLGEKVTSNWAEYQGMTQALAYLVELIAASPDGSYGEIHLYSDSQEVVEQINGNWQVKDSAVTNLCLECQEHLRTLRNSGYKVALRWIRREQNRRADRLCNEALDDALR